MPPRATICIPWRASPSRIGPYERVRAYWATHFPDWPVITADSSVTCTDSCASDTATCASCTPGVFNLGQARNNAVRQAQTPVVVLSDADTVVLPPEVIGAAVGDPVGITWPHKTWRLIGAQYAGRPFEDFPSAPVLKELPKGLGATMVCTADEYWRLGGQPEEFTGWGWEDAVFHAIASTLSTTRRGDGIGYSIEHNRGYHGPADSPEWTRDESRGRDLAAPYHAAMGRPWLMRELLARREVTFDSRGGRQPVVP